MVMFLLSFANGSKSAEGGKNPLPDMDPGGPNPLADLNRGSKSARTPAIDQPACNDIRRWRMDFKISELVVSELRRWQF